MDDTKSNTEVPFSRVHGWLALRALNRFDTCIPTTAESKNYVSFVYRSCSDAKIGKADIPKKLVLALMNRKINVFEPMMQLFSKNFHHKADKIKARNFHTIN